jgi:hypothetical protein
MCVAFLVKVAVELLMETEVVCAEQAVFEVMFAVADL